MKLGTARPAMEERCKCGLRALQVFHMDALSGADRRQVELYIDLCGRQLDTSVLSDAALMRIDYLYTKHHN